MGQNCEDTIEMCLESVKQADEIIFLDGGSTDKTLDLLQFDLNENFKGVKRLSLIIKNKYNQEDKSMNGKQRNFYLNYLKEYYPDDWCLVLDTDEVLEDFGIEKIKTIISQIKQPMLLSPKIHHFIGDLGHEDFTKDAHYVPNRLFKIVPDLLYPETEHPILQGTRQTGTIDVHIWHLRECLGIFNIQKKHENNTNKSDIHNKEYLDWWHKSMLFGNYPRKPVYYGNIPTPIKMRFKI